MGFDEKEFQRMVDEVNSTTYYTDLDEKDREKVRLLAKERQSSSKLIEPNRAKDRTEQPEENRCLRILWGYIVGKEGFTAI